MREISGVAASPGITIGPVYWFEQVDRVRLLEDDSTRASEPAAEWARFEGAIETARADLNSLQAEAEAVVGSKQAAIFHAQSLMLGDPDLQDAVNDAIYVRGLSAVSAVAEALQEYQEALLALNDAYLSARAADVQDLEKRLLRLLLGEPSGPRGEPPYLAVIFASDLTPSDTMLLDRQRVLGFCVAQGGATSHTAILARGLGVPAVVGLGDSLLAVDNDQVVIVDGVRGKLIVDPDACALDDYHARREAIEGVLVEARRQAHEPAVTRDGRHIAIGANVGSIEDAFVAREACAEGIGLLRTEFLFLERSVLPSEDDHYRAYCAVLDIFDSRPVTLRTLDIGGDKELACFTLPKESNPFLGCRAIRLALKHSEIFKPQIRAALKAGHNRNLRIMFPMIATLTEVRRAIGVVDECRAELQAEGQPCAAGVEIGIMVEIPAAAVMAEHLVREVDFLSIGTNDLAQYTLAADRTNPSVGHLCDAFHPAVLRLIRSVTEAAYAHGKPVALCGELAGEPLAIPILLGLGVDELSMNPLTIPLARHIIRSLTMAEAHALAASALDVETPEQVRSMVVARLPWIRTG